MININILEKLNVGSKNERLDNLKELVGQADFPPMVDAYINNHIHTTYSFSPYSPTAAVYAARAEGLCTAGIIDHDSIGGAREFLEAAKIIGMPVTVGMECRVSMDGTAFANRRTNNPDQIGCTYMTIQSVPHKHIEELNDFFAPYRAKREERNRKMTDRINGLLPGIDLDYEKDVRSLSNAAIGGSVTERHLMYGLAKKIVQKVSKGHPVIDYLSGIGLELSSKQSAQLSDLEYPFYEYDLLGILKGSFVPKIYVDAKEELPNIKDVVALSKDFDAMLCYAYLGDVTNSVTGDKVSQKFEDDYVEELFESLSKLGVYGVTYMPTRNTKEQLKTVRTLCDKYGLFQVSGEDINTPRQSFIIEAMKDSMFDNLIDSTWKMIEHENH